jgi:hypothetical protein
VPTGMAHPDILTAARKARLRAKRTARRKSAAGEVFDVRPVVPCQGRSRAFSSGRGWPANRRGHHRPAAAASASRSRCQSARASGLMRS